MIIHFFNLIIFLLYIFYTVPSYPKNRKGLHVYTSDNNIGIGYMSLSLCSSGSQNIGIGKQSLFKNNGNNNIGIGYQALYGSQSGESNIAIGNFSLSSLSLTGSNNIAIGNQTGANLINGNDNIYIGINIPTISTHENSTIRIGNHHSDGACYISNIRETALQGRTGNIKIDGNGRLGIAGSSQKFKENITSMKNYVNFFEKLLALNPVTFSYKEDPLHLTQFGLIAEAVHEILPEIVIYNDNKEPFSIQYELLIPILLYAFQQAYTSLKQELQQQQVEIDQLKSSIQSS